MNPNRLSNITSELKQSQGTPRVLISRSALLHNARLIRRCVVPGVKICAVVKADAYGHGAEIVADALCNFSADDSDDPAVDQLAVASIDEAAQLPELPAPILVLRPIENAFLGAQRSAIELAIVCGFILTIDTAAAANDVARIAMACGRRAMINVMLDTGLSRGGCAADELESLLRRIESHGSLKLASLGTHLASSERPHDPLTIEQLRRFRLATDEYAAIAGVRLRRHVANSGATFLEPTSHFEMIRPGISLYGIDPTGRPSLDRALRPVLKWTAPLIGVREVPAGATVGYNQTWTAWRPTRIGLVPVGYADGYCRSFSNRGVMLVDGVRCPVIGRVSMDLTTIDLTAAEHATVGDDVAILDNDPLSACSVYELAKWAETIPYEILTGIGPRIRRVAVDPADEPVAPGFSREF